MSLRMILQQTCGTNGWHTSEKGLKVWKGNLLFSQPKLSRHEEPLSFFHRSSPFILLRTAVLCFFNEDRWLDLHRSLRRSRSSLCLICLAFADFKYQGRHRILKLGFGLWRERIRSASINFSYLQPSLHSSSTKIV